jgi:hypothetical protein
MREKKKEKGEREYRGMRGTKQRQIQEEEQSKIEKEKEKKQTYVSA